MWGYAVRMALRQLASHRAYAIITIGGLALGLAGCLLILGYIRYEQGYDAWIADSDRVYQVQSTLRPPGQPVSETQASPFALYELMGARFGEIEAITSVFVGKTVTERDGEPVFLTATVVDPEFFQVFALPFRQGSAATALTDVDSIVLTESDALRLLGTRDALGKLITMGAGEGKRPKRVSGVLRDLPPDTNLKLGIVSRRDTSRSPPAMQGWWTYDQQHFVKLRAGADAAAVNAAIPAWKRKMMPPAEIDGRMVAIGDIADFRLVPITDVHLGEAQLEAFRPGGDPRTLATFAIVAVLTLVMAVMNFVNLSTARAVQRAREVAMRKVLGASRRQLIAQFLVESLVLSAAAMLIALTIVELATPWIGHLIGADLHFTYLGDEGRWLPALALFGLTALAGGLYPAIHLSRFKPAPVLHANRASRETRGSGRLRAGLVVVQFAIAIGLIASTIVIYSQTRFVETVDPGYRRDGLIQIANAWRYTQGSEYDAARKEMLAIPGVTASGRTGFALAASDKHEVSLMRPPSGGDYVSMGVYGVDPEFLPTMGIDLLAGRMLGERFAGDRATGVDTAALATRGVNVVVNRTAARKFGIRSPDAALGKVVAIYGQGPAPIPATIVGVVEDSRFRTARDAMEPLMFLYDAARTDTVLVRYTNARPGEVMAAQNKVWRKFEPEIPFEARFADDIVRELYAADRARGALFAGFSALAVVIACLGLYSLAAFATERRTKEIGIRKVLGARVRDIVRLLAWQFSKPVVIANLIAWPVAWWAMRDWLNTFDARIALGPGPFAVAGILAFAIAIATVAGHSLRVARMSPIHALRYE